MPANRTSPMTPAQMRALRRQLGLRIPAWAVLLGVDEETARGYERGVVAIGRSVALLARLLVLPGVALCAEVALGINTDTVQSRYYKKKAEKNEK